MADVLAEIESAISEVSSARSSITRRKTKQVSSSDETDRLKSVAFAWFQTHRPPVVDHPSCPDLSTTDAAYRTVMDATGRHAARQTYKDALRDAKESLILLRGDIAASTNAQGTASPKATTDKPPNFSPLAGDVKMEEILNRRWNEVQQCLTTSAYLSATVMMGGLLESLLLARINGSPDRAAVFTAKQAARDRAGKTLPLSDWKFVNMVEVSHELGWITKSAKDVGHVLRDFRNYIHPHKEYTDGIIISDSDAGMFWEVAKAITRQVLASVGKTP